MYGDVSRDNVIGKLSKECIFTEEEDERITKSLSALF